jgi:putative resolvase
VNLTEWARLQGVHPQTAYRWFQEETLPVPAVRVNSRSVLVTPDAVIASAAVGGLGLYARVSSHGQKPDFDRLGRMNTELAEAVLSAHGRRLVVLDAAGAEDDLVRDMTEILTSFCARLYGSRLVRNRAERALRCAARDVGPSSPEAAG